MHGPLPQARLFDDTCDGDDSAIVALAERLRANLDSEDLGVGGALHFDTGSYTVGDLTA
jgi:hypothetical protein